MLVSLFNKNTGRKIYNFFKRRLLQRCFLVSIANFLRTPTLKKICERLLPKLAYFVTQKMKLSIKDFFNKCDQICCFLRICSHSLKKSLMENFSFWVMHIFQLFPVYCSVWHWKLKSIELTPSTQDVLFERT